MSSNDRKRTIISACKGQLKDVIELSTEIRNDMTLISWTLIKSCCEGHLEVVKWIVRYISADINYSGVIRRVTQWGEEVDYCYTPLTAACDFDHLDVVKYLLDTTRADVNLPDRNWGLTPLIAACSNYSFSVSMYLLSEVRDLNVNTADNYGYTALHFAVTSSKDDGYTKLHEACMKGDVTEVMSLVCMCDHLVNVQDNVGRTPLHWACYFGHSDIVMALMIAGADETNTDVVWQTPAQVAETRGHTELLNLLDRVTLWDEMQYGVFLNSRKAIKVAAECGELKDVIELSTKFSYDMMLLSEILIESCCEGHLKVVKKMVEHTATDVNYSGVIRRIMLWGEEVDYYYTPLTAASDYSHLDVIKYLLDTTRADVNLPDRNWGVTPLIKACRNYNMSVLIYLLNDVSGLDVNTADFDGNIALHYAVSSSEDNGRTQLHEACIKNNVTEVIRLVCGREYDQCTGQCWSYTSTLGLLL